MLAEIRNRLQEQIPALKQAGLAGDFAALRGELKQAPAAFVLPGEDRPRQSHSSPMRQLVDQGAVIVLGLLDAGPGGLDALDGEDGLKRKVIAAMLGWRAPGSKGGFQYGGGSLAKLDLQRRTLFYQMRFSAPFHIQEESNA